MHSRGFRTSDPQRKKMGDCAELAPLVSLLFWAFLNLLPFLKDFFIMQYIERCS